MTDILHSVSGRLHGILHKHVITPFDGGMIRSCRNRLTGVTRWSTAEAGPFPVWRERSVLEVGRLNVGGAR